MWDYLEWIKNNANAVVPGLTAVIAFTAVLQYFIYRAQLSWMQLDERPWLAVVASEPEFTNGNMFENLIVENTGKTPATHIEGWKFLRPVAKGIPLDYRRPRDLKPGDFPTQGAIPAADTRNVGVFFPHQVESYNRPWSEIASLSEITVKPALWTPEMDAQYHRGDIYILLTGEFIYRDPNGTAHWTKFCKISTPVPGAVPPGMGFECGDHNSVDENK